MNFRLTKYNPKFRDENGFYTVDEWTSVSQIGSISNGVLLSSEEYMRVESAYVRAMESFCQECKLEGLVVEALELRGPEWSSVDKAENSFPGVSPISRDEKLYNGLFMPTNSLDPVIRSVLREEICCALNGGFDSYINFGHDYYTYIGSSLLKDASFMQEPLLFIEPWESPYGGK